MQNNLAIEDPGIHSECERVRRPRAKSEVRSSNQQDHPCNSDEKHANWQGAASHNTILSKLNRVRVQ